jgi:hypothetical protein
MLAATALSRLVAYGLPADISWYVFEEAKMPMGVDARS